MCGVLNVPPFHSLDRRIYRWLTNEEDPNILDTDNTISASVGPMNGVFYFKIAVSHYLHF